MTDREFDRELKPLIVKGRFSVKLAAALPDETKTRLVHHIVRNRCPVVVELIPHGTEFDSWLDACGYLYRSKGKKSGFTFRHTCEHTIV